MYMLAKCITQAVKSRFNLSFPLVLFLIPMAFIYINRLMKRLYRSYVG